MLRAHGACQSGCKAATQNACPACLQTFSVPCRVISAVVLPPLPLGHVLSATPVRPMLLQCNRVLVDCVLVLVSWLQLNPTACSEAEGSAEEGDEPVRSGEAASSAEAASSGGQRRQNGSATSAAGGARAGRSAGAAEAPDAANGSGERA